MKSKPHVLLIAVDHWPASLLGAAGHPTIQTPTLDQMTRSGVRFVNAYSECPVCIPARRTLLTGMSPRSHGDRSFQVDLTLPEVTTLPQAFRNAGYQAFAVGKLHVWPPRSRAGFDDVILNEEGRSQYGFIDDYEIYLGDQGLAGQQFLHGMSNNDYVCRPWHLEERHHPTNWTTREMARMIQRRDRSKPGFWYLSYTHPHPPLTPPASYLDLYRQAEIEAPVMGDWAAAAAEMPGRMNRRLIDSDRYSLAMIRDARRAFYALCTHIDHQIRVVVGTLREEGVLDNTILMFLSDHGDMLGDHGLWAKRLFYEDSAGVPMILVGVKGCQRASALRADNRLVGLQDVMPTLLDLAGVEIPATCDGQSMVGQSRRDRLYGEYGEGHEATRMIHDGRYKLVYFASGNRTQLFDIAEDPREMTDLAASPQHQEIRRRLTEALCGELYGDDEPWISDGKLVGLPESQQPMSVDRTLSLQRGAHWPPPPVE